MKKRILFICSQNKFRSRTAHEIFSRSGNIEVDSVGTEKEAKKRVINLGIPDIYEYMDPALIEVLWSRLKGLE